MPRLDTQDFLRLVEESHELMTWDSEATGLNGDYNSILCVSMKRFGGQMKTFQVKKPGEDKEVCNAAARELEKALCWITYYGKGFDVKMLRARLLYHGLPDLKPRHHIDLFFTLLSMKTSRHSQAHLLRWLGTTEQKMDVGASQWSEVLANPKKVMPVMVKRCESDVEGLESLYKRTKQVIKDVTR